MKQELVTNRYIVTMPCNERVACKLKRDVTFFDVSIHTVTISLHYVYTHGQVVTYNYELALLMSLLLQVLCAFDVFFSCVCAEFDFT